MNVAFGGTLHQHLPDMPGLLAHGVPGREHRGAAPGDARAAHPAVGDHQVGSPHVLVAPPSRGGPRRRWPRRERPQPRRPGRSDRTADPRHEHDRALRSRDHVDARRAVAPGGDGGDRSARSSRCSMRSSTLRAGSWLPGPCPARRTDGTARTGSSTTTPRGPAVRTRGRADPRSARPRTLVARIDHVGSTSVPGLAAKPIIDIQLSLVSMVHARTYVEPLVGARLPTGSPIPGTTSTSTSAEDREGDDQFHIHACEAGERLGTAPPRASATRFEPIPTPPPRTRTSNDGWPPTIPRHHGLRRRQDRRSSATSRLDPGDCPQEPADGASVSRPVPAIIPGIWGAERSPAEPAGREIRTEPP